MSTNDNINLILGDPKKAILKLSGPIMISMLLIMAYNLADSLWLSGLGANALAALGFITPLFMIMVGFGNGIGAGANSFIARAIGAKDKERADNGALHSLLIGIVASILMSIILLVFLKDILILMGADTASLQLGLEYGNILSATTIIFIIEGILASILRSEGDVKRSTYAMSAAAILNIIIDPIFIYTFKMGIAGAAWATVFSALASCIVMIYWMWGKKNTYLSLELKNFHYKREILLDTLGVAFPASLETLLMSITTILINGILVMISSTSSVAVYTVTWRVISLVMIPPIGLATAVLTVVGAAYGARRFDKMKIGLNYGVKVGIIFAGIISAILFIFAPQVATLFSYGASSSLKPGIIESLRVLLIFPIFVPLGMTSVFSIQGIGKGFLALLLTTQRALILMVFFAWLTGMVFGLGAHGVWWGIVIGEVIGSIIAYIVTVLFIRRLEKKYNENRNLTITQ